MSYWHAWLLLAPLGLLIGVAVPLAIYLMGRRQDGSGRG